MISYGGVILPEIPAQFVAFVESRISPRDAFGFYRPPVPTDPATDHRPRRGLKCEHGILFGEDAGLLTLRLHRAATDGGPASVTERKS